MHRIAVLVATAVLAFFPISAAPAYELTAAAQALIDQLEAAAEASPYSGNEQYFAFQDARPAIEAEYANEPFLPVVAMTIQAEFSSRFAIDRMRESAVSLAADSWDQADVASGFFIAGVLANINIAADERQLAEFGAALDGVVATGVPIDTFGSPGTYLREVADAAIAAHAADKPEDELNSAADTAKKKALEYFVSLVPKSATPAFSGVSGKAFVELQDWNNQMWSATTAGLNVVADAISSGKVDDARLKRVTSQLQKLANTGPWGGIDASTFLREMAKELPGVGKIIKRLWREPIPPQCKAINCDCGAVEFGLLTGEYRKECVAAEEKLIAECAATRIVSGSCNTVAAGPFATPIQ